MRQITAEQTRNLALTSADFAAALEVAFRASAKSDISWKPKSMIGYGNGAFLMSTFAAWPAAGYGIFHMLAGADASSIKAGSPAYSSTQLLTDASTGEPLAMLDGAYTSTILPAGITRLMTPRLARPKSGVAVIVGAGTQARVNLEALDGVFPIDEVRIISRSQGSAERFAEFVSGRGQRPRILSASEAAFQDADTIITTVPAGPHLVPVLDPKWVPKGAFVNAVDLGRSWLQGFQHFDRCIVDDLVQAEQQYREGRLAQGGPFDSEIAQILQGDKAPRVNADERIALIHPGNVVGILAISALFYDRLAK